MTAMTMDRRTMLCAMGAVVAGLAVPAGAAVAETGRVGKPLRGLFPIAETPFTAEDTIDMEGLANQVRFCNRGGVPGIVWPQIASGWSTLSVEERLAGAEAMLAAGKGGKTAVVIGVQTKGNDLAGAVKLAEHAAAHGADGIVSLPPEGDDAAVLEYYKAIGKATELPLFVQTIGDMSTDSVAAMYRAIPTMRVVKDESGDPLARVREIRAKTEGKVEVFAGRGVTLMMDEMRLGFTGFCPVVGLSDVFQQAWELWEAGKKREAYDMFGRVLAFLSIQHASQYLMVARGIFKEGTKSRPTPGMGPGAGTPGVVRLGPPTAEDKRVVREGLEMYLRPYLRG